MKANDQSLFDSSCCFVVLGYKGEVGIETAILFNCQASFFQLYSLKKRGRAVGLKGVFSGYSLELWEPSDHNTGISLRCSLPRSLQSPRSCHKGSERKQPGATWVLSIPTSFFLLNKRPRSVHHTNREGPFSCPRVVTLPSPPPFSGCQSSAESPGYLRGHLLALKSFLSYEGKGRSMKLNHMELPLLWVRIGRLLAVSWGSA